VSLKNGIEEACGGGVKERDGLYASLSSSIFSMAPAPFEEPASPGMPLLFFFGPSAEIFDKKEAT
jgi:hypothetical protein